MNLRNPSFTTVTKGSQVRVEIFGNSVVEQKTLYLTCLFLPSKIRTPEPDPGFPRGRVPVPNFPENCMKMTKIGPIGRGTRLRFYYADPPLDSKLHDIYLWIFIAARGGCRQPANNFLHVHSLFHFGQKCLLPDSFPAFSGVSRNLVHLARIWQC